MNTDKVIVELTGEAKELSFEFFEQGLYTPEEYKNKLYTILNKIKFLVENQPEK